MSLEVRARRRPAIHNIHDAEAVLADAFEEIRDAEHKIECVGMELYHIATPELVKTGLSHIDPDGGLDTDVD